MQQWVITDLGLDKRSSEIFQMLKWTEIQSILKNLHTKSSNTVNTTKLQLPGKSRLILNFVTDLKLRDREVVVSVQSHRHLALGVFVDIRRLHEYRAMLGVVIVVH